MPFLSDGLEAPLAAEAHWVHLLADAFIVLGVVSFPAMLLIHIARSHERNAGILSLLTVLMVTFGLSHFFAIHTLREAIYPEAGWLKAGAAVFSFLTTILFCRWLPETNTLSRPDSIDAMDDNPEHRHANEKTAAFAVLDAAPMGFLVVSADGRVVYGNRRMEGLLGRSREDLTGLSIEDLVSEDSRDGHPELRHRDGRQIPVEIDSSPLDTPDGRCTLVAITDISEKVLRQESLSRLVRELEQKDAELDEFVYLVSHDLKEPLRSIRAFGELLREDLSNTHLNAEADKDLQFILAGTERLKNLLDALLRYSRVGTVKMERRSFPLSDCLDIARDRLQEKITETNAHISVGVLPEVYGDRELIGEVFLNLLDNALKFRRKEEELAIGIESTGVDPVLITVSDNGTGIDPQMFGKIFEPFQKLQPRDACEGVGIGLSLVRKIVERHGGRVTVQSEVGKGTRIGFDLPVHR